MLEDLLILLIAFTATTLAGLMYAFFGNPARQKNETIIHIDWKNLPPLVDTRFSPLLLQTEERVKSLERRAAEVLGEFKDESEKDGG